MAPEGSSAIVAYGKKSKWWPSLALLESDLYMGARWKIEHVELDFPPAYLPTIQESKIGGLPSHWLALVPLLSHSLVYQLIPPCARNASRAFAAKCCGAAQLHCTSNFRILQCQSAE